MQDKANRDQKPRRNRKKPKRGESIGQEFAWIIGQLADFWFDDPGPELGKVEKFLFSWVGSMTFF